MSISCRYSVGVKPDTDRFGAVSRFRGGSGVDLSHVAGFIIPPQDRSRSMIPFPSGWRSAPD